MNITKANKLFDEGTFTQMYKAGFITYKVFLYREIYLWVQAQIKTRQHHTATYPDFLPDRTNLLRFDCIVHCGTAGGNREMS